MGDFTLVLIILAGIFLLPWGIVVAVAIFARDHFKAYMPWYIGGAFAFEILLFIFFFAIGAVA